MAPFWFVLQCSAKYLMHEEATHVSKLTWKAAKLHHSDDNVLHGLNELCLLWQGSAWFKCSFRSVCLGTLEECQRKHAEKEAKAKELAEQRLKPKN